MMEGDYRRKTSSLAEERRAVREDRLALQRERNEWLAQRNGNGSNGDVASSKEGTMSGNPAYDDPLIPEIKGLREDVQAMRREREVERIQNLVERHTPWLNDEPVEWRDDHLRQIYTGLSYQMSQTGRALTDEDVRQTASAYHARVVARDKTRDDARLQKLAASKQEASSKAPGGAGRGGGGPALPEQRGQERLKLAKGMDARAEMQRVAKEAGLAAISMLREAAEE